MRPIPSPVLIPVRALALLAAALAVSGYTPPPLFRQNVNVQPAALCRDCHIDITDQWKKSSHARADREVNPLFGQMYLRSVRETRGATFRQCLPCHETASFVQNDFNVPHIREASAEGVTCSFCHAIDAKGPEDARPPYELDLSKYYGTIQKPQTTSFHQSAGSPLFGSSEFCGGCHKYSNQFGVPISDTIGEWKRTKYARQGVTCQACHMPGRTGRNTLEGPVRERVADHSFTFDPAQNPRLKDAVTLRLEPRRLGKDSLRVDVIVTNAGAGHSMPTGNDQKMLLVRLRVLSDAGVTVWENDPFEEWNVSVFGLTLADELTRWPAETWAARSIVSDRRIPAGESRRIHYDVPIREPAGPVHLKAQVLFRTGRPATLATYGLDADVWGAERVLAEAEARVP